MPALDRTRQGWEHDGMLRITRTIALEDSDLEFRFVRASGPGGQHVNTTSTACQLRFDAANCSGLPEPVRRRLLRLAGSRATDEGTIVIDARNHRSQKQNRQDALDRLTHLIRRAARPKTPRRKTRPTLASRRRRLETKRRQGEKKRLRRPPGD